LPGLIGDRYRDARIAVFSTGNVYGLTPIARGGSREEDELNPSGEYAMTGNDDNVVMDLITPYCFQINGKQRELRIVGGLLGHWAVWTKRAVDLLGECRGLALADRLVPQSMLRQSMAVIDCNAAFFDTSNNFAGCIAGLHEVLRRQGLFEGIWCLDPQETLSPGQKEEIDRVYRAYPELNDDEFVREGRDTWLRP
jgi:hypothetical protein